MKDIFILMRDKVHIRAEFKTIIAIAYNTDNLEIEKSKYLAELESIS